ncbi:MAG: hypothetical protein ACFFBR_00180 [Promethearchaeota archaeon]
MRRIVLSQTTKKQLAYGTIQGLAIAFFFFLFLTYSPSLYRLSEFPYIQPNNVQIAQDAGGDFHAIYADGLRLENGSLRAIIKHRTYHDETWFRELPLSDLVRTSNPYNYFIYSPPWDVQTTLACSYSGEMAAGWLDVKKDYYDMVGSAYYILNDGVVWGQPEQLLQRFNITHFQLAYSIDGILYAAWIEFLDPLEFWDSWQLMCWEVGSQNPPQVVFVALEFPYGTEHLFELLPGRDGRVSILFKPEDEFYQASNIGGNWTISSLYISEVYDTWAAAIDSQENIHLAYEIYNSQDGLALVCDGRVLSEDENIYRLSLSIDRSDNLQVFWAEYDYLIGGFQYYTQKFVDYSWVSRYHITGLPNDLVDSQIVMMASNYGYLVMEQSVGKAGQLAHYYLGSSYFSYAVNAMVVDASFVDYISTSVPQMLSQFQLFTLGTGSLIIVGILVFFPLVFLILRSSFIRLISGI